MGKTIDFFKLQKRDTGVTDNKEGRLFCLDFLKTLSIIAVIFYHLGLLSYGYLGVEVFFVVSGYNFSRKVNDVSSLKNLFGKVKTTLKKEYFIILYSCLFCLVIGLLFMFPIYYNVLAYNSVATLVLSSNVLQVLKATDYWNVSNMTNPLMHMWFIGVLIKSQIILYVLVYLYKKVFKDKPVKILYFVVFFISLLLNFIPKFPFYMKFYLVPFRLYEIVLGCLIFEYKDKIKKYLTNYFSLLLYIPLVVLFFIGNFKTLDLKLLYFLALLFASAVIVFDRTTYELKNKNVQNVLCLFGRNSYPIYIWHQIVIAFLTLFFYKVNFLFVLLTIVFTTLLCILTTVVSKLKFSVFLKKNVIAICVSFVLVMSFSFIVYKKEAFFSSYKDFGVDASFGTSNSWIYYVDNVYSWDKNFEDNGKTNVLVVGNSFGRDFANVLNESQYSNQINIVYMEDTTAMAQIKAKADSADMVFYSVDFWEAPTELLEYCPAKLYIVGNKIFANNANVWVHRFEKDYYDITRKVDEKFLEENEVFSALYGEHFVDMMSPVMVNLNSIKVFTDKNTYISIDGKHLSKEGAVYYASILDLARFFN